ncbi:hypothetical protein F4804DRAFT_311587 [Jackrogersella minutella]|nr:hypothetical protein F4804DRAFT_311587 [Jackrogersella minutella]
MSPGIPSDVYKLYGVISGPVQDSKSRSGEVATGQSEKSITVTYDNFLSDGSLSLTAQTMSVITTQNPIITLNWVDQYFNVLQSEQINATKSTSPDGFHLSIDALTNIFNAKGTLGTTLLAPCIPNPARVASQWYLRCCEFCLAVSDMASDTTQS